MCGYTHTHARTHKVFFKEVILTYPKMWPYMMVVWRFSCNQNHRQQTLNQHPRPPLRPTPAMEQPKEHCRKHTVWLHVLAHSGHLNQSCICSLVYRNFWCSVPCWHLHHFDTNKSCAKMINNQLLPLTKKSFHLEIIQTGLRFYASFTETSWKSPCLPRSGYTASSPLPDPLSNVKKHVWSRFLQYTLSKIMTDIKDNAKNKTNTYVPTTKKF